MSQETTASDAEVTEQEAAPYFASFAMCRESDSIVQDILVCLNTFKMSGYFFVEITDGMICDKGMRYNALTGQFEFVEPVTESSSTGESSST